MAVASASRAGHLLFDKVAAMSLAFSRSAFPRGWVAVLLFATAPVSQTTARAQTEMMPLPLQQHVHHAHGDSVVDKKMHHHTAPEKTKQSSLPQKLLEKTRLIKHNRPLHPSRRVRLQLRAQHLPRLQPLPTDM